MRHHLIALSALFCAVAGPSYAVQPFKYTAAPAPGSAFDITMVLPSSDADYWCAAADHALDNLGAEGTTRIYVLDGAPARAERFSLAPPPGGPVARTDLSLDAPGNNLSAAAAFRYCYNVDIKE